MPGDARPTPPEGRWVSVGRLDDLPEEKGKVVRVGRREVALFRIGGRVHAMDNICPHAGGPMAEGQVVVDVTECKEYEGRRGPVVECPWHYWGFEVESGQCAHFAGCTIEVFEVRLEGDEVQVLV